MLAPREPERLERTKMKGAKNAGACPTCSAFDDRLRLSFVFCCCFRRLSPDPWARLTKYT